MKQGRKVLAFIVLIGVLSGLFCGCSDNCEVPSSSLYGVARQINEIKDSGYIKIGVFRDNKPFGYLDENGEYQGFDVYLARRFAKDLGVKVQLVPVDAEDRSALLENGEVDLVLADYAITSQDNKIVDFARPYIKTSLGIISSVKNKIKDISELTNKVLIVVKGTMADLYFTKNYPDVKLVRLDQYQDAIEALKNGLGDAFCSDLLQGQAFVEQNPDFVMGPKVAGSDQQIAPAVQKENTELMEYVNEEMDTLQKDNFFTQGFEETMLPVYGDKVQKDDVIIQ